MQRFVYTRVAQQVKKGAENSDIHTVCILHRCVSIQGFASLKIMKIKNIYIYMYLSVGCLNCCFSFNLHLASEIERIHPYLGHTGDAK